MQLCSALEIFSCCMIMRPPTKLQVFANFWPQKMLQPFITPVLSRFISARLFSIPQVETEVKRTPICGCCWDPRSRNWWIKEGPKRGIFSRFSETVRLRSIYIYIYTHANGAYFEFKKKDMCLPHISSILKKNSVPKLLDCTVWTQTCRNSWSYFN